MSKLTGGKMLAQLNRKNPNLGALISKLIAAHNHIAAQIGVDPVGQAAAPPPPQGVDVIVTGEQTNIRVVDNNPTNRARTYFSEVHTDAQFTSPKMVVQHGATRDAQVVLPTFDSAGVMQAYHIRTYSQTPGSPPSPPVAYPTYVTMAGTTSGDLPASAGSGTSPATGTVSAQGYGAFPTRAATKSNTAVYTGGGGGGGGVGGVTQIVAGSNITISPSGGTGIVTVNSAASGITQLTGDVTAGPGSGSQAATVAKIQGVGVSAAAPTSGQVLKYDGTVWIPEDESGGMANPMTTMGDLIIGGASGAPQRLAAGTVGQVLTSNGPGATPSYQAAGGGGATLYFGQGSVLGTAGADTITLGSTPIAGSTIVSAGGSIIPFSGYSIADNVITLNPPLAATGTVNVAWATTNSTPGGVAINAVILRGSEMSIDGGSVAIPAAAQVGDLALLFMAAQNHPNGPTGWTQLASASWTDWWSGGVWSKTLTSADISAGSVSTGDGGGQVDALAVIAGGLGAIRETDTGGGGGGYTVTDPSITTSSGVAATDYALIFGSLRGSVAPTCDIGELQHQVTSSAGSGSLYFFQPSASGSFTAAYTMSGYNPQGAYLAVVVGETT